MIEELEYMMYNERLRKRSFFTWGGEGWGEILRLSSATYVEGREKMKVRKSQNKRQQTQAVTKEIPFRNKEGIFHNEGGQTGTDFPEMLWYLHPGRYSEQDWQDRARRICSKLAPFFSEGWTR